MARIDNMIGLDTTGVGTVGKHELYVEFDTTGATEAAYSALKPATTRPGARSVTARSESDTCAWSAIKRRS